MVVVLLFLLYTSQKLLMLDALSRLQLKEISNMSISTSLVQVEMLRSQLGDHEKNCAFRLVNCVDLACQRRIPVSRLLASYKSVCHRCYS